MACGSLLPDSKARPQYSAVWSNPGPDTAMKISIDLVISGHQPAFQVKHVSITKVGLMHTTEGFRKKSCLKTATQKRVTPNLQAPRFSETR